MDKSSTERLDKILALADSNHEGEAVVAVRKAREILLRDGLSFGDLARAVLNQTQIKSPETLAFLTGGREHMESKIRHLNQQVSALQSELQTQDFQLDFWRRRAFDLEHASQNAQTEAERWKKLASETADRLWELGRSLGQEAFMETDPTPESLPPASEKEVLAQKRKRRRRA
ncbi:MAG: hypothetical protein PHS57_04090 [Alphaproteobacteria bacterium]|nr:hypothetical protein [Alphaproteobacteria bacterium]